MDGWMDTWMDDFLSHILTERSTEKLIQQTNVLPTASSKTTVETAAARIPPRNRLGFPQALTCLLLTQQNLPILI